MKTYNKKYYYFYENYEVQHPFILFLKILFSFGLYAFFWIYKLNSLFEEVDENAADTRKLMSFLFFYPCFLFVVDFVLIKIFDIGDNIPFLILKIVAWSFVILISLYGICRFCKSFADVTMSNYFIWYFLLYLSYVGIVLYFYEFYYTIFLILVFVIPKK